MALVDMRGDTFHENCKVARAVSYGGAANSIEICTVTKIYEGKLYLDNSKQAIRFPNRLLIIEKDPLIKLIDDYDKRINKQS